MSYTAIDTAAGATRAPGDLLGRIEVAMVKKAGLRAAAIVDGEDQREFSVCRAILDGTGPESWVTIVLVVLDTSGQLANPTDAQLDTAVNTSWAYFIKSRSA